MHCGDKLRVPGIPRPRSFTFGHLGISGCAPPVISQWEMQRWPEMHIWRAGNTNERWRAEKRRWKSWETRECEIEIIFQANCTASLCLTAVRVINGRRWEHKKCDKTLRSCTDPGDMSCTHLSDDRCVHDDNKLRLVIEIKRICWECLSIFCQWEIHVHRRYRTNAIRNTACVQWVR